MTYTTYTLAAIETARNYCYDWVEAGCDPDDLTAEDLFAVLVREGYDDDDAAEAVRRMGFRA